MRAGTTSAIAGIFLAGGLTVTANPCLHSFCKERFELIESKIAARAECIITEIGKRLGDEQEIHRPGETYVIIVSENHIVGVDRNGYVSCEETSYDGDLPALTGFTAAPDSVGESLDSPELELGLAIVRAFNRSADMFDMLSEVYVGDLGNPRVVLCGGVKVDIGWGDYITKIARLRQILLQAPDLGISPVRVDMRFGPQVVVEYERTNQQPRKEV